jgi:Ca2+-binding EF-hand superfamily protein
MSSITGLGSSASSYYATLNQQLFKSVDSNKDGNISQAELEQAFSANGGTAQSADQLYKTLDPNGTGSVNAQQFSTGLQSLLSSQTQAGLIQAQADQTTSASSSQPQGHGGHLKQLFNSIDSNGDGSITQSELEKAVTGAGGTTQQADQLFSALDPNGTGSVSLQQFVSGMKQIHQAASAASGTPSDGGVSQLFNSIDANGDGSITKSELEKAFAAQNLPTSNADTLFAALDPNGTGSITEQQFASGLQQLAQQQPSAAPSVQSAGSGSTTTEQITIQITETTSTSSSGQVAPAAPASSGAAQAGGGGGGASSASSTSTTTAVTYNADGTITTTVTNPDGTQTVTTSGTPTTASSSSTGGSTGSSASGLSVDQLLKNFFSVSDKLAQGSLSSGTLGQLLTQQQAA